MNTLLASTLAGSLCLAPALAGTVVPEITMAAPTSSTSDGFANARRPISNPTLFDLALPTTNIHPLIMFHQLPDFVQTTAGLVPMGGDVQVYALQFEIALTDRLSFVANKDGYVDINPDTTPLWSDQSGFANLGAGFKYAFILDPASGTALSGTMTFEIPTGNHDVFQGEGNGGVNLILNGLKLVGDWQFAGSAGVQIPFSDQQATSSFVSAHASYEVCKYFIPLIELNWFHVLDTGDGRPNFFSQAGGAVPVIAQFEGGDLLNFGAGNAFANRDFVTAAIGFRSRLMDNVDAGVAYEFPLTSEENGIMKDRITVDVVWKF
ncbi:MAG: hypothetical protein CFE26_04460 [Verrucomicrobiales bacterium VVV1]|nr:MAG: hypothetical protein CFE26_04460 [Verrucomicrobiales bacterium VVV1]